MREENLDHLIPRFGLFLASLDSGVTRGCNPARRSVCTDAEDPIGDDRMIHLGNIRHIFPRLVELEKPHIVVICSSVVVDIQIADIGIEVVGRGSNILA